MRNDFSLLNLDDINLLRESSEVECKLASGKDGKGALPKDMWETYSAFANTDGGYIILGLKEKNHRFSVVGIENIERVRSDLVNTANNSNKVNINLLNDDDISEVDIEGKKILCIYVRRARRQQRPVFLKGNPFGNTYTRRHESDHRLHENEVNLMIAEQVQDSRDEVILSEHYNFAEDIDIESLKVYKNLLAVNSPHHAYLDYELFDFFKIIGGWRKDRETGKEGMTLAGVLMFGTWTAIRDAAPKYFVDYQERPEAKTEARWIDRIVPDGTWSGNLFDFYRKVYQKISADLKVPFHTKDGQRKSDTPVHIALREALVNCLVHADYSERVSVLVVKRPDLFGFRNPGLLRLSREDVFAGGISDCRNRTLHQMFLLIGLGERAGSGMPKIISGWKSANWRFPRLEEKVEPAQTILELSTASLIPDDTREQLVSIFGDDFNKLSAFEQLIITTAAIEGYVNHERACQLTSKHSREVTLALPRLETKGYLQSTGENKQKFYTLPGVSLPTPDDVFTVSSTYLEINSTHSNKNSTYSGEDSTYSGENSTYSEVNSTHSDDNSTYSEVNSQARDQYGRLISEHFTKPLIDELYFLKPEFKESLFEMANLSRQNDRVPREKMEGVIISLCTGHFISAPVLAEILNRNNNSIRQQYLKALVDQQKLELAFPQAKNSPKQCYSARILENEQEQ